MALENPAVDHHGTPKNNAYAITPADNTALLHTTSHIYVGGAGNLAFIPAGDSGSPGTVVTLTGLSVGWHPIRARVIMNAGTTVTLIVGFY